MSNFELGIGKGFSVTTAIVLAGGLGTRLRSVVPDLPKPMAPVAGRPFLEHLFDYWIEQGIDNFVLSVGYRHELITKHFGKSYNGAAIEYAVEETPLGTGGGLLLGVTKLSNSEPFLLLNGDTFFAVNLKHLIDFASTNRATLCFSLFRTTENARYMAVELSDDGRLASIGKKNAEPLDLVNGGVYWVELSVLKRINFTERKGLSLENDVFPALMNAQERVFGMSVTAPFLDIGVPEDYLRASALIRNK